MNPFEWFREKLRLTNAPSASTRDPKKSLVKRLGLAFVDSTGAAAKKDFQEPTFDLTEITKAYNTDSYVRQAIDKYVDLMFKAGWDITGKNQAAMDYMKIRLAVISEATQTPTKQFFLEIAEDLVKYGNAFIVKARAKGTYSLPPGVTATPVTGNAPVAGYFTLPPTTMKIAREENGTIVSYQQEVEGKTPVEFKPEDIIHIHWKKERGQAFGVPFLLPVLDDVKILRQVEEDVVRLIYRHLFPLHVYQVGLDRPGFEATDEEIELVREEIRNMTLDGGIVIPERHNLSILGNEGEALKVEGYLEYYRKRVFTGLGVSETIMGVGDTTNRATAESMTTEMHDRIKAFQRVMAEAVDFYIFGELLREGGFDPILRPEDDVDFQFKEIDLDSRTKLENEITQLWNNNLMTFEEARQAIGYDPVADESRLFYQMVGNAQLDAEAQAEIEVGQAKSSTTAAKPKVAAMRESVGSLNVDRYSTSLKQHWSSAHSDVINVIKHYYINKQKDLKDFDPKEIGHILNLSSESMQNVADSYIRSAFILGVNDARIQANMANVPNVNYEANIRELLDYHRKIINTLINEDLKYLISKTMRSSNIDNILLNITGVFNSLSYRLSFITNTEVYRAYNYGFVKSAYAMGYKTVELRNSSTCDQCVDGTHISTINATALTDTIPPLHPNCTCTLDIVKEV
jgi:hypothetical protein